MIGEVFRFFGPWDDVVMFFHKNITKRYVPIVGIIGLNDYHFYWNRKERDFFFLGLCDGEIMEKRPISMAPEAVLYQLAKIDVNKTLNMELAIKLKKRALELLGLLYPEKRKKLEQDKSKLKFLSDEEVSYRMASVKSCRSPENLLDYAKRLEERA